MLDELQTRAKNGRSLRARRGTVSYQNEIRIVNKSVAAVDEAATGTGEGSLATKAFGLDLNSVAQIW
jgi:hypothetical protein